MFRHKPQASRAPTSVPRWSAGRLESPAQDVPSLSACDPFGGWPAFPPVNAGSSDGVLGERGPAMWPDPAPPRIVPDRPGTGEPAPDRSASAPSNADLAGSPSPAISWLPLLTHAHGEQPRHTGRQGAVSHQPLSPPSGLRGGRPIRLDSTPRQPDRAEAAALAAAFAADYLSWDETDQGHRGRVLARYLHMTASRDPALLGWSGKGRQRADFALPAAVRPDGPGRLVVDVRVRVTPYRRVGQTCPPAPAGELEVAGVPAVAPAPTASGWEGLGSQWILLAIPIIQVGSRLAVGAWGEQLRPGGQPNVAVGGAAADGELE